MRLLLLAIIQSILLSGGQVLLKIALRQLPPFAWSWSFLGAVLVDWPLLGCGLCYGAASLLWLHIIKHYPFGMAYPMVSLSYVFGMLAAIYIFHEHVSPSAWAGIMLIMAGCWLVAR